MKSKQKQKAWPLSEDSVRQSSGESRLCANVVSELLGGADSASRTTSDSGLPLTAARGHGRTSPRRGSHTPLPGAGAQPDGSAPRAPRLLSAHPRPPRMPDPEPRPPAFLPDSVTARP